MSFALYMLGFAVFLGGVIWGAVVTTMAPVSGYWAEPAIGGPAAVM